MIGLILGMAVLVGLGLLLELLATITLARMIGGGCDNNWEL